MSDFPGRTYLHPPINSADPPYRGAKPVDVDPALLGKAGPPHAQGHGVVSGWSSHAQKPQTFSEAVEPYLNACPGPALAERGLRLVAYQRIAGIPGLELVPGGGNESDQESKRHQTYLRSISDVAVGVHCDARYLSDAALRRGYSYSRALRWLRFLHALAMRDAGVPVLSLVRSLGFSDPSGWTRFTKALIGKAPRQIPRVSMGFWVRLAIEDVYLNGANRDGAALKGQQDMRDDK